MSLEKLQFDTGLTAYVDYLPSALTNEVKMFVPYGSVQEKPGEEGVAHALEHCVHLQTERFADRQALRSFDRRSGMHTSANTYYTRTVYEADGVELEPSLVHLREVLLRTKLPEDMVMEEMKAVRREAKSGLDNLGQLHAVGVDYAMFGSPMGRRVLGYSDRLSLDPEVIQTAFKRNYALGNMTLLVSGAATPQSVAAHVDAYLGDGFQSESIDNVLAVEWTGTEGRRTGFLRDESQNARVTHSHPLTGVAVETVQQNYPAFVVASSAMANFCFQKLRYDEGISYDGYAGLSVYNHPAGWRLSAGVTTDPEHIQIARRVFNEVLGKDGSSYTDDQLQESLATYTYDILKKLESPDGRIDNHLGRLERYRTPEDLSVIVRRVRNLRVGDVRVALDALVDLTLTTPRFEHISGPHSAVSDVDELLQRQQFA